MKKVILLALLLPLQASGQIFDNFESGRLVKWVQSSDGHWNADATSSISGTYSLHHIFDNPDAGTDQIGIPLKNLHPTEGTIKWSFMVRHGYDPSSSNNWAVFLMTDSDPASMLPGTRNKGFAIGVNITGYDDTLRLLKLNGAEITEIVNSRINWQNNIGSTAAVRIAVERSPVGEWKMSVFNLNSQTSDTYYGSDSTLFPTEWFGVYYKYSSTRDRLLWLDDINIEGVFYDDKDAPSVTGCKIKDMNSLEISFSEELSEGTIIPGNFSLNEVENKSISISRISGLRYQVLFGNRFINKSLNNVMISTLCDRSGNCSDNVLVTFTPAWAEPGDVVITEIMADPLPAVSLPGKEYLEIANRTGYSFSMKNWSLSSEGRKELFPDVKIEANGTLIICSVTDTLSFIQYGKVAALKQFISLNDKEMIISLSDSSGKLIHGVDYSSKWYGEELKAGGGWSLEMIDTRFPFFQEKNWGASTSRKGGTPGKENSISGNNPDILFKGIMNVFPYDSQTIIIRFSETLLAIDSCYDFILTEDNKVVNFYPTDPIYREFGIRVEKPLLTGKLYSLTVSDDIKDFAGNSIEKGSFNFGIPEFPVRRDIVFNELLFNPLPADPDYIEFYNISEKVIDASRLFLVAVTDETRDTSAIFQLSEEKKCILPGSYYTVTTNKNRILNRYFSSDQDYIFEITSLPSMPDDKGHLILLNRELDIIDEVFYDDKMHYSVLENKEGVALEKIRQQSMSSQRSSWHSASESSGWGTPGVQNSLYIREQTVDDRIALSSTKITPDNDGYEDMLVIDMNSKVTGKIISITVFDETGTLVRRLADKVLAGSETSIIWDGNTDDGKLVNTGIYIVFIEMFDTSGKVEKWKKVCTVIKEK
jgi:hypothetical protein